MKFISIVFVHWAMRPDRSEIMRKSMDSLIESIDYPAEIIAVDNGNSAEDSSYLLYLCHQKKINVYIRNSENMHFGYARSQGIAICNGDYICISDNDILYKKGWLSKCIDILDAFPERKIYSTPFCDLAHARKKYWSGELEHKGKVYGLNMRAGSNCFVARRDDFKKIGMFIPHRVAGTKWTNRAVSLGFLAAVVPDNLASDMAFRHGYCINASVPVKLNLGNNKEIYFNVDEYKKAYPEKEYREQMFSLR